MTVASSFSFATTASRSAFAFLRKVGRGFVSLQVRERRPVGINGGPLFAVERPWSVPKFLGAARLQRGGVFQFAPRKLNNGQQVEVAARVNADENQFALRRNGSHRLGRGGAGAKPGGVALRGSSFGVSSIVKSTIFVFFGSSVPMSFPAGEVGTDQHDLHASAAIAALVQFIEFRRLECVRRREALPVPW